jgi:hypothetical protein
MLEILASLFVFGDKLLEERQSHFRIACKDTKHFWQPAFVLWATSLRRTLQLHHISEHVQNLVRKAL